MTLTEIPAGYQGTSTLTFLEKYATLDKYSIKTNFVGQTLTYNSKILEHGRKAGKVKEPK